MAKRHSVRMSRHEVWPEGQTRASESPLTRRTDERAMKGMDPENTFLPITMRSDLRRVGGVALFSKRSSRLSHEPLQLSSAMDKQFFFVKFCIAVLWYNFQPIGSDGSTFYDKL
jgi:hypothetical protein